MKILYVFLGIIIGAVIVFFALNRIPFFYNNHKSMVESARCEDENSAINEFVGFVVTGKYRDSENHMIETIEYQSNGMALTSLLLMNDRSGAFAYINVGDSIVKLKGGLGLTVWRKESAKSFQLDFGCKD